jgi:two-component system NarL family sensor kinase
LNLLLEAALQIDAIAARIGGVIARVRAEDELRKKTHELGKRVKELNCLYGISKLMEKPNISFEEIFQGIVYLIPPALRYPQVACAQIILEGQEFKTENFRETVWKQACDIVSHGKQIGTLEVCYLEERPESKECPFLKEGKDLINVIGERIGKIVERKQGEEHIYTLTQQLIKAQEIERQRISRELHDNVAQDLFALKIACETLFDDHLEAASEIRRKVSELSGIIQRSITDVRNPSYNLRPPGLDKMGLVFTATQYCKDFSDKNGINVDFFSAGMDRLRLDFDTKINLYRVTQEALNNIKKHAGASHVTIRLVASHPNIILRINDNGKGFDVKVRLVTAMNEKRMGLQSMRERRRFAKAPAATSACTPDGCERRRGGGSMATAEAGGGSIRRIYDSADWPGGHGDLAFHQRHDRDAKRSCSCARCRAYPLHDRKVCARRSP